MLDRKVPPSSKNAPRTRSLLATILKVAALGLLIVIAVFVVSAIYAGHLEGARAIAAVQERLGKNIDVEIFFTGRASARDTFAAWPFLKANPPRTASYFMS